MQAAISQDERRARRLRRNETIAETDLGAQGESSRLLHQKRVGSGVDDELSNAFGLDDPAGALLTLEHDEGPLSLC
jgi:hypothetical protein